MLYVLLSCLLFSITFFVPYLSLFTMTTFLMPLYKGQYKRSFWSGFIWGLIVFASYWYWIIILFKNQHLFYTGIILWILATIWCSLFSGIWFYFLPQWPILTTVIFFVFVTKAILLPLGNLEGIPFLNPLVLLGKYPLILKPLYYLQDIKMFFIIFGIQYLLTKQNRIIKIAYFILLIILGSLSLIQEKEKNYPMNNVTIVTPWWHNQNKGAMFDGYRLAHDLCEASNKNNTQLIITPESTFCFDVKEFHSFISIWCDSANNVPILLGTHAQNERFPHNALLLLHNDEIKHCYFKQHKMPFLERSVWIEHFLDEPILSCELIPEVEKSLMHNDIFCIAGKMYQLYMCSEFFVEFKKVWGYPILLLWNDSWLSCDYMKELADLFIIYFKQKYKIDVYHVATSGRTNIAEEQILRYKK